MVYRGYREKVKMFYLTYENEVADVREDKKLGGVVEELGKGEKEIAVMVGKCLKYLKNGDMREEEMNNAIFKQER